jgi:hypothetical protein
MLDIAVAYNRYKFFGYEFLSWLWFAIERSPGSLAPTSGESGSIAIGNRIVLENFTKDQTESITIKGDDLNLDAARLSLKNGALVTEINLVYKSNAQEWLFTLKGESFSITNLKTPQRGPVDTLEDTEGAVLEKVYLLEQILKYLDFLFKKFIKVRLSPAWKQTILPELKKWVSDS